MPDLQVPLWRRILEGAILGTGIAGEDQNLINLWRSWQSQRDEQAQQYRQAMMRRQEALQQRQWGLEDAERQAALQNAIAQEKRGWQTEDEARAYQQRIGEMAVGQLRSAPEGARGPLGDIVTGTPGMEGIDPSAFYGQTPREALSDEVALMQTPEGQLKFKLLLDQARQMAEAEAAARAPYRAGSKPDPMEERIGRYMEYLKQAEPGLDPFALERKATQMAMEDVYGNRRKVDPLEEVIASLIQQRGGGGGEGPDMAAIQQRLSELQAAGQ